MLKLLNVKKILQGVIRLREVGKRAFRKSMGRHKKHFILFFLKKGCSKKEAAPKYILRNKRE